MNLAEAKNKSDKIKSNPEWRAFKSRWDGRIPKPGTAHYVTYVRDAKRVQSIIESL